MRDSVCPIGDCTGTVRFAEAVVEVTPRYRLHDLGEVDEFATCPSCDAQVAGFYEETEGEAGGVELILDIDEDEADGERADGDGADADGVADDGAGEGVADGDGGFDAPEDVADGEDGFDAPEDVLGADG